MPNLNRRSLLAMLVMPAGCAIQSLPPLKAQRITPNTTDTQVRLPQIGQFWIYKKFNFYNSALLETVKEEITQIDRDILIHRHSDKTGALPSERHGLWGQVKQDPYWDTLQTYDTPLPAWPSHLTVETSQTISTHYRSDNGSFKYWINTSTTVTNWERITLACGTFDTVRIDTFIRLNHPDISRTNCVRRNTIWLAPALGRWVARETTGEYVFSHTRHANIGKEDYFRWELDSWG
jgi:hypothetical protein